MPSPDMLDYPQTATLLGVKLGTLYSLVSRREIPHHRLGRRLVRFERAEIESWIRARAVPAAQSAAAESSAAHDSPEQRA